MLAHEVNCGDFSRNNKILCHFPRGAGARRCRPAAIGRALQCPIWVPAPTALPTEAACRPFLSRAEGGRAASDKEASAPVGTRSFALSGASRPLSISPAMTTLSAGCVQDCSAARVKDSRRTRCTPPDAVTWSSSFQPASCTSTMPARWHGRAWPCCATASAQTWGVILSEGEWGVLKGLILEKRI